MITHLKQRLVQGLLGACLVVLSFNALALSMTVILAQGQVWPGVYQSWAKANMETLTIHTLVRVDALEQQYSRPHNGDEQATMDFIEAQFNASDEQAFVDAWQTALIIHQFKIDRLPAIIINNQAVYYGLNPTRALAAYEAMD